MWEQDLSAGRSKRETFSVQCKFYVLESNKWFWATTLYQALLWILRMQSQIRQLRDWWGQDWPCLIKSHRFKCIWGQARSVSEEGWEVGGDMVSWRTQIHPVSKGHSLRSALLIDAIGKVLPVWPNPLLFPKKLEIQTLRWNVQMHKTLSRKGQDLTQGGGHFAIHYVMGWILAPGSFVHGLTLRT